jgi:hypothetical protein
MVLEASMAKKAHFLMLDQGLAPSLVLTHLNEEG